MIAKIKTRADFGGIVNYANDQKNKKKCATLLAHEGVCAISNKTIADSFQIQASIRPKVKSPVKHADGGDSQEMDGADGDSQYSIYHSPTSRHETSSLSFGVQSDRQ